MFIPPEVYTSKPLIDAIELNMISTTRRYVDTVLSQFKRNFAQFGLLQGGIEVNARLKQRVWAFDKALQSKEEM